LNLYSFSADQTWNTNSEVRQKSKDPGPGAGIFYNVTPFKNNTGKQIPPQNIQAVFLSS
jgi:hypothetical protein